jgi:hypothetical protein
MAWVDLSATQLVSFNNLKNACDTGVFTAKTTIPATNEIITKTDADTYASIDISNSTYAAKSSNQLISKQDLTASFTFDADYMLLTYRFTNGLDLDTRSRLVTPNIGQVLQSDYLGWGLKTVFPGTGTKYIEFGGDNTGTGVESILIYVANIKTDFPSATSIVADCRCFWYNTVGTNPVNIEGKLWKGGSPIKQGGGGSPAFSWTNPTATATLDVNSNSKAITLATQSVSTSGERLATLTYTIASNSGVFNINDTTTPSV